MVWVSFSEFILRKLYFLLQRVQVVFVLEVFVSDPLKTSKYLKTPFGFFKSLGTAYMEVFLAKDFFWDEIFEVNGDVFEFVRVLERLSCPGELPTGRR